MGQVMNSWRLTLVGTAKGPGMADIASILGREEVLARMNKALIELK
jgi:glutamyl-tRNA synthetase